MFQRSKLKALGKAMLAGTLAGGVPPMVVTVAIAVDSWPIGYADSQALLSVLLFAIMPLLLAAVVVIPACLLIGMPIAAMLKRSSDESVAAYILLGAGSGFLVMLAIMLWSFGPEAFWFAFLGAFSGGATGYCWSRVQEH